MRILPVSWDRVFALETPLLELIARGAVLYFSILILLRLMPRRSVGELATMDLIFALLIAEAAAHALGDYTSVADGVTLIASLMAWNYAVNAVSQKVKLVERLVSPPPLQIVRDGQMLRRNMRSEFLTEEELLSHLRLQDIEDISEVKSAFIEGEGAISVIKKGR